MSSEIRYEVKFRLLASAWANGSEWPLALRISKSCTMGC